MLAQFASYVMEVKSNPHSNITIIYLPTHFWGTLGLEQCVEHWFNTYLSYLPYVSWCTSVWVMFMHVCFMFMYLVFTVVYMTLCCSVTGLVTVIAERTVSSDSP